MIPGEGNVSRFFEKGLSMIQQVKSYDKEAEGLPVFRVEYLSVPACFESLPAYPVMCCADVRDGCSGCAFFDELPF